MSILHIPTDSRPVANDPFRIPGLAMLAQRESVTAHLDLLADLSILFKASSVSAEPVAQNTVVATASQENFQALLGRVRDLQAGLAGRANLQELGKGFADFFPADVKDGERVMMRDLKLQFDTTKGHEKLFSLRQFFEVPVYKDFDAYIASITLSPEQARSWYGVTSQAPAPQTLGPSAAYSLYKMRGKIGTDGVVRYVGNFVPSVGCLTLFLRTDLSSSTSPQESFSLHALGGCVGHARHADFKVSSSGEFNSSLSYEWAEPAKVTELAGIQSQKRYGRRKGEESGEIRKAAQPAVQPVSPRLDLHQDFLLKHFEPLIAWAEGIVERIK